MGAWAVRSGSRRRRHDTPRLLRPARSVNWSKTRFCIDCTREVQREPAKIGLSQIALMLP